MTTTMMRTKWIFYLNRVVVLVNLNAKSAIDCQIFYHYHQDPMLMMMIIIMMMMMIILMMIGWHLPQVVKLSGWGRWPSPWCCKPSVIFILLSYHYYFIWSEIIILIIVKSSIIYGSRDSRVYPGSYVVHMEYGCIYMFYPGSSVSSPALACLDSPLSTTIITYRKPPAWPREYSRIPSWCEPCPTSPYPAGARSRRSLERWTFPWHRWQSARSGWLVFEVTNWPLHLKGELELTVEDSRGDVRLRHLEHLDFSVNSHHHEWWNTNLSFCHQ